MFPTRLSFPSCTVSMAAIWPRTSSSRPPQRVSQLQTTGALPSYVPTYPIPDSRNRNETDSHNFADFVRLRRLQHLPTLPQGRVQTLPLPLPQAVTQATRTGAAVSPPRTPASRQVTTPQVCPNKTPACPLQPRARALLFPHLWPHPTTPRLPSFRITLATPTRRQRITRTHRTHLSTSVMLGTTISKRARRHHCLTCVNVSHLTILSLITHS